ncbi:MAG TPA: AAA family ATPase [Polyangia bacterium]|nr:AAA family ATPase [Polyangia bacterium]
MSDPHPHPPWAEELRRRYLRNEATQFILHGNVFDLVEHGGELLPVREYLSDRLLADSKDVLVVYNVSTGGKIARRKGDLGGAEELLVLRDRGKFLPAMERVLKTTEKVALIVEYAETVAPAADAALMSDEDRGAVVTLHRWSMAPEIEAADSVVVLLAENLTELHPKLVSNPKIATVRVPMPDEACRRAVIACCLPKAEPPYAARLAATTAGLRAVQIQAILQPPPPAASAEEQERVQLIKSILGAEAKDLEARARKLAALTRGMAPDDVRGLLAPQTTAGAADEAEAEARQRSRDEIDRVIARRKREIIERECYGLIEFVEPQHDFRVVGGIEGVKTELGRIARNIRSGNTERVPMGLLFTGPMGAGKTFVAEAFAKESGLTTIKLKNFRSKWVGATESNLERIFQVIQAIGQVLVIIDEGDRAFGSEGDGDGDGGTSSRVIARIKEFMSDTANRGRILFILMTNRPDKLDIDIKRAGRLDKKIPLLYAQTAEEVEGVLVAQLRKHRLSTTVSFPADRAAVSQPIVGLSNADFEAIVLLAAELAAGPEGGPATLPLSREHLVQAIADYLPSRDAKMLEYMELCAVFEASNRTMLPKKYQNMSGEELAARLDVLRLECANRR